MNTYRTFTEWLLGNLDGLDALVLDVDGVLMLNEKPLPGSHALIACLRERNLPFGILTNTANISVEERSAVLKSGGLVIEPGDITSSAHPLFELVKENGLAGSLFFVMGDLGRPCNAEKAGLRVTRSLSELPDCKGVIVGEENFEWEPVINGVVNYLILNPQAPLIVPNPDFYFPTGPNRIRIASGGPSHLIQHILFQYGVSISPIFLGKPFRPIFAFNHQRLEGRLGRSIEPHRVLMLGDSLAADVKGAIDFGYRTALVLTGVTSNEAFGRMGIRPDAVFERL